MSTKLETYKEACNYPGRLDERSVETALAKYLAALGEKRQIIRLPAGWQLAQYPSLEKYVDDVLKEFDALAARDARDALAALAARAARDALAARDARDAVAAVAALAARDALAALDALAARDALAALDALAARDARDALDALAARDARDAVAARNAKQRFASWCIQSPGWSWHRFELSWIATTFFGAKTEAVRVWSEPLLDAFCAGCWLIHFTSDTLYWVAKPKVHVIEVSGRRQLHNAAGAALESDVEPLYFLNGVLMNAAHVLTPAQQLDPVEVMKETNVEVRRELIRKMGVEMLLAHLPHRVLDKRGDYEVLAIDFPDLVQDARYLKMLNPSIGTWHMEGIERECDTVEKAVNWRAGVFGNDVRWNPGQLT